MAKASLTLDQVRNYCVFDAKPIPAERVKRNAVTCSKECAKAIERQRMLLMEQSECKYCRRPSTPEERESYKRWRQWEKAQENTFGVEPDPAILSGSLSDAGTEEGGSAPYPYIYNRWNSGRKGQRCRLLLSGNENSATHVQIQFEDGETLIADKMNLASATLRKKYSEKRGRPRKPGSTLAAKHEVQQQTSEGEQR